MAPVTVCEWFALCDREATHTAPVPGLGQVPVCPRCAERVGLDMSDCQPVGGER